MNDPIERVRQIRPRRQVTSSDLAGAERNLYNAINLEEAKQGSVTEFTSRTTKATSGHTAGEPRRRRAMLVSALVTVMMLATGITTYIFQGPSSTVSGDLAVEDTAQSGEDPSGDEGVVSGADESVGGSFDDLDLSGSTFDFEADDMSISVGGDKEYRPNGSVWADGYYSFDRSTDALRDSLSDESLGSRPAGGMEWAWQDRDLSDDPVDVSISMNYMFDETSWWISRISVVVGQKPDVFVVEGEWLKTPLDQSFEGDLDVALEPDLAYTDSSRKANLIIKGGSLSVYSKPSMCRNPQGPLAITISERSGLTGDVGVSRSSYFSLLYVVDTETCQVAEPAAVSGGEESRYIISATSADETMLKIDNSSGDSLLGSDFYHLKVGETRATFTVTEKSSGEVVHSVELPVRGIRPDNAAAACKKAQENSEKYALVESWHPHPEARLNETSGLAQLWNVETCQPVPVAGFDFEAKSEDPNIATVESPKATDGDGTQYDRPDAVQFDILKKRTGKTTLLITVTDPETGEVVAELAYPIEAKV